MKGRIHRASSENALFFSVLILFGTLLIGRGGVVLNDSFTYPDGDLVGALGSAWQKHSGSGPATVSGGKLVLTSSLGEDVNATLTDGPYSFGSVVYASFVVNFSSRPSSGGSYFAHFRGAPSGFRGLVWASRADAEEDMFRIGIKNSTADSVVSNVPMDLSLNTDYLVVIRYVVTSGRSTIWINPVDELNGGVTATQSPSSVPDIGSFAFRQSGGIGTLEVDDLLVGTSFADVTAGDLPPTISNVLDRSIPADTSTGPIEFAVGDDMTALGDLVVMAESSDQSLIPDGNIFVGGDEGGRNVNVTPLNGRQGSATITLTVDDGTAQSSTSFKVIVGAPIIARVENQIVPVDSLSFPIVISVDDLEEGASILTVTAASDDQQLIPDGGLIVTGSGSARELSVTPATGESGLATITVFVDDGVQSSSTEFKVTVFPQLGLLFSDNFNRADGPVVDGLGDWDSHSGFYQEMQIVGERVMLSQSQIEDVHRKLDNGNLFNPEDGYVFFASMVVNFSELPAGDGSYFAHFKDDGFAFRCRLMVNTNGAPTGTLRIGIGNGTDDISPDAYHPAPVSLDEDALIVVRYNSATGESRLWVNPVEERSGYVDATDEFAPASVESFAFRQAGGLHGVGALTVDDLLVGASFHDVVGDLPPIIRFARNGANLQLSWPSGSGFKLLRSSDLPGSQWIIVPASQAGADEVTNIDISSGSGYFRLEKEEE